MAKDERFVITTELPEVQPSGLTLYKKNYFCRFIRSREGVVFNEWDTDKRFAYVCKGEHHAMNINKAIGLDGTSIEPFIS